MQTNSATKIQIVKSTIYSLLQISVSMSELDERSLQKLDQSILNYLSQRNLTKIQKYGMHTSNQDNHEIQNNQDKKINKIDVLSIDGLNTIHNDSQEAVLNLQKQMADFFIKKSHIEQNNLRLKTEFLDIKEGIGIFQLCKQLINELSKFQSIQHFCQKLAQCRKKSSEPLSADMLTQVQKYISKVDHYICSSGSEHEVSDFSDNDQKEHHIYRIGKNGKRKKLVDFIQ